MLESSHRKRPPREPSSMRQLNRPLRAAHQLVRLTGVSMALGAMPLFVVQVRRLRDKSH